MKLTSFLLPVWAARGAVAGLAFLAAFGFAPLATAQEEPPAEEQAPAEEAAPEAAPAEAAAPADAAAPAAAEAAPEQLQTIPVDTAQEKPASDSTDLDSIEVTGSRIRRSDYETESPILVLRREDIEKAGLVSIGDILQNLPQSGAALSRAFNNGGNGATEIDLRNLGSNRVLVLVNGRRWVGGVSAFNTSGVDLNTIPISVIESIEILKDGASAIYGSDAIAGVVNIKTRQDFVGAELRTHLDATDRGDGVQQLISLSSGVLSGKTSVFFDVSYVNQGELNSGDRDESSIEKFGIPRDNRSRGSRFMEYGNSIFIPTPQNAQAINAAAGFPQGGVTSPCPDVTMGLGLTEDDAPGVVPVIPLPAGSVVTLCDLTLDRDDFANGTRTFKRVDTNVDQYNYAPVNYLITPSERSSIYGQLSHQLFDNVRLSGEMLYNMRKSTQQLAETPDGLGDVLGVKPFDVGYVASDNPYNPTNPQSPYYINGAEAQDIGKGDPAGGLVGLGGVLRRFKELGPRIFSQTVDTFRVGGGFDGMFERYNRAFSWDLGYAVAENRLSSTDQNLVDNSRLARASGPVAECIGVQDPTDPNAPISSPPPEALGCVPFDWFGGPGSLTPEMLNYIRYTAVDSSRQRQRVAYANISTDFAEFAKVLAGPLGLATGIEYREEFYSATPDPLKVAQVSSTNSVGPTRGSYDVFEAYTEVRAPILQGIRFAEELELSLAGRYSKYSSFGDNVSGKLGVMYKPMSELLLRTTYSTAFRAPAITDLYLGRAVSYPTVADPCADPDRSATTGANCDADGAATTQNLSQVPTVFGGNPDLEPETATTTSLGFVYSPEAVKDFNVYVDWYRIEAEDFISPLGPDAILDLCYTTASRAYCDAVHRDPTSGQLVQIDAVFQNFSNVLIEGVDFNFDWVLPLPAQVAEYGQFKWVWDAAYVSKYDQTVPTATGEETIGLVGVEFGGAGAIPRLKVNTGIEWDRGPWSGSWNLRYIHHLWEPCNDGYQDPGAQGAVLENPTPVLSLEEYGLCSDTNNPSPLFGADGTTPGKANELPATFYNDVTASYELADYNTRVSFGINNVLDQDPPAARSAFADSYDKVTHEPWGSRTPYVRLQVNF